MVIHAICVCGHDNEKHEWYGNPPAEEQHRWKSEISKRSWNSKEKRPEEVPCFCFECSEGLEGCRGFKERKA